MLKLYIYIYLLCSKEERKWECSVPLTVVLSELNIWFVRKCLIFVVKKIIFSKQSWHSDLHFSKHGLKKSVWWFSESSVAACYYRASRRRMIETLMKNVCIRQQEEEEINTRGRVATLTYPKIETNYRLKMGVDGNMKWETDKISGRLKEKWLNRKK